MFCSRKDNFLEVSYKVKQNWLVLTLLILILSFCGRAGDTKNTCYSYRKYEFSNNQENKYKRMKI